MPITTTWGEEEKKHFFGDEDGRKFWVIWLREVQNEKFEFESSSLVMWALVIAMLKMVLVMLVSGACDDGVIVVMMVLVVVMMVLAVVMMVLVLVMMVLRFVMMVMAVAILAVVMG